MNEGTRGHRVARGTVVAFLLALDSKAAAQGLPQAQFGAWEIEAGLEYDALHQQLRNEGSPDSSASVRRFRELIGARNQGFWVLDPRVFTANAGIVFEPYQERDSTNGQATTQHGKLLAYDFDATILAEKPYNGSVYANRNETFYTLPFAGTTKLTVTNEGATFRIREDSIVRDWGWPYFSSAISAYRQHVTESTTTLGGPFRRDEVLNAVTFVGHNGFETSDLDVRYEYNDVQNLVSPQSSFISHNAAVNYSLDFGPDLNRRWDSRVTYDRRTGSSPLSILNIREDVRVDHYDNLFTDYRYLFARTEQGFKTTTTQTGAFQVGHEIYPNLTNGAELIATHEDVTNGTRDQYSAELNSHYRRSLPFSGQLTARGGGRYQINDNNLVLGQIDVIDEPHVAPSPIGGGAGFLLDHAFVVVSTIVMVDTQGGSRQSTTAGVDYDVVVEGDRVRIIVLASSNVIREADSLAVSYSYGVPPHLKYSTAGWWIGGSVDFRWIMVSFDHEQSDQRRLAGDVGALLLQDFRRDQAAFELRGEWASLNARAGFAYQHYDSTLLAYNEQRYFQIAQWQPGFDVAFALNADETFTDYTLPVRRSDTLSATATADWHAPRGWYVTAYARTRRLQDSQVPKQTISEAGLRARFVYGKLEFGSLLSFSNTSQGGSHSTEKRLELKAIRRF